MASRMHFDNWDSLRAPAPGLIVSLGSYAELAQEGMNVTLVLDGQKARPEVLSGGQLLIAFSLACWLSASSTHRRELPGNYPVFTVVMVIYHYVERIWRILVTPIF